MRIDREKIKQLSFADLWALREALNRNDVNLSNQDGINLANRKRVVSIELDSRVESLMPVIENGKGTDKIYLG